MNGPASTPDETTRATASPLASSNRAPLVVSEDERVPEALAAFEALSEAVALGDPLGERVLGTTRAFRERLGVPVPERWAALLARLDELDGRDPARRAGGVLADGRRVLRMTLSPDGSLEELRRYLLERDDLFSTSRTISISEMATALAHELNQPIGTLSNLLGGVRVRLERGTLDEAALADVVDSALEQTRFADGVITRIRDFTRDRRPEQRALDMGELLRRSVALLDWLLVSSEIDVDIVLPAEPLPVRGDATMLQQVLVNLLRNAVEATRGCDRGRSRDASGASTITVSAARRQGTVAVAILDRGHGLGGAGESALFVPFATSRPDGMGVGLSICRSFLELHQGRLWLAANEEGGCTAHVELPEASAGREP